MIAHLKIQQGDVGEERGGKGGDERIVREIKEIQGENRRGEGRKMERDVTREQGESESEEMFVFS